MKKLIAILTMLTVAVWIYAASEVVNGIEWNYTVTDGKAMTTRTLVEGDVTVPSKLGGYPVTEIGTDAFSYNDKLKSIIIPDSVTSIGDYAFGACSSIDSIIIPDSVINIGEGAFYDCNSLISITIPGSVRYLGFGAFAFCLKLQTVTILSEAIVVEAPFICSESLAKIYISENSNIDRINLQLDNNAQVIKINLLTGEITEQLLYRIIGGTVRITGCLLHFDELVKIPEMLDGYRVTSIGVSAFSGCSSLTSITIPDGVTSIGSSAFYGCSGLTSITIPDGVTSIGGSTFRGCSSLTSITIPDGVTTIGNYAFYGCSSLTSITIPDGVTSIGSSAFYGCSGLTSITIPDGVTSIGDYAFYGCSSLTSITIPDSVTSIGDSAFYGCSGLTSITIPDSVTSIGDSAFYGCSGLTSITIPDGVTSIGSSAFYGCSGLTSITIPDGVTSIGNFAFRNCSSLTYVTIGNGVTKISGRMFSGCSSLTSINVNDNNNYYLNVDGVLFNKDKTDLIYCPSSAKNGEYVIPKGVQNVGEYAFNCCDSLTLITIPDSVTSIGEDAFYVEYHEITALLQGNFMKIYVDENNKYFSSDEDGVLFNKDKTTLIRCPNRKVEYIIPNSVTNIGDYAFNACSRMPSITIPEGVERIGTHAFHQCRNLVSAKIPTTVKTIGTRPFWQNWSCARLEVIYLPEGSNFDNVAKSGMNPRNNRNVLAVK